MLRAGALYFAIIVAFFIAVISAAMIMLVAHYRNSYLKDIRHQRLVDQLDSGVAYVLSGKDLNANQGLDLYGQGTDSLVMQRSVWGIYELVQLRAAIQQDTLKKMFLVGKEPDSVALYLSDEDRPLSISGNTRITGNVMLPKSGLRQAYAEGKPYTGEKLVFQGQTTDSKRQLPVLEKEVLEELMGYLENVNTDIVAQLASQKVSFDGETSKYYVGKIAKLENVTLSGKILLISDSIVVISASAKLTDVQVYAPIIKVEAGFRGTCQLFASDSLLVADRVSFGYPSALGVLRANGLVGQPQMNLGSQVTLDGIAFSYESERTPMQTMISLGKGTVVRGEVFCTGLLKLEKDVAISGKVSCNRFIMRTTQTLYENFLIDVSFNRRARSKYYLSSVLFGRQRNNKVMKWLD